VFVTYLLTYLLGFVAIVELDRRLRGELLRVHAILLRSCLISIYQIVTAQGFISAQCLRCLDRIFTTFVDTFHRMKREDDERAKAREALFRYRKRAKTEQVEWQAEQDEKMLHELFPDYFKEFNEITGETNDPNNALQQEAIRLEESEPKKKKKASKDDWMTDDIVDENETAENDVHAKAKAAELEIALLAAESATYRINDEEVHELSRLHFQIFSTLRAYLLDKKQFEVPRPDESKQADILLQAYKTSTELIRGLHLSNLSAS